MIQSFELFELHLNSSDEIFSAYNGRYLFNVDKAYEMIENGAADAKVVTYKPQMMRYLSHPEFSVASEKKYKGMKIDYEKPIGIVVNFRDPESKKNEWILIDGNHRTRKATEENRPAKFWVIADPNITKKFMSFDKSKPHQLFPEED